MVEIIKKLWNFAFHTEKGLYLVFGVLTTVVSLLVGLPMEHYGVNEYIANFCKNAAGILFAYFTNRAFVFESKTTGAARRQELVKFVTSRLITLVIDMALMAVFVEGIKMSEPVSMVLSSIVVIILNYVFSKLFVFTKK